MSSSHCNWRAMALLVCPSSLSGTLFAPYCRRLFCCWIPGPCSFDAAVCRISDSAMSDEKCHMWCRMLRCTFSPSCTRRYVVNPAIAGCRRKLSHSSSSSTMTIARRPKWRPCPSPAAQLPLPNERPRGVSGVEEMGPEGGVHNSTTVEGSSEATTFHYPIICR